MCSRCPASRRHTLSFLTTSAKSGRALVRSSSVSTVSPSSLVPLANAEKERSRYSRASRLSGAVIAWFRHHTPKPAGSFELYRRRSTFCNPTNHSSSPVAAVRLTPSANTACWILGVAPTRHKYARLHHWFSDNQDPWPVGRRPASRTVGLSRFENRAFPAHAPAILVAVCTNHGPPERSAGFPSAPPTYRDALRLRRPNILPQGRSAKISCGHRRVPDWTEGRNSPRPPMAATRVDRGASRPFRATRHQGPTYHRTAVRPGAP